MTQIIDNELFVYYDENAVFTDFTRYASSQDITKVVAFDLGAVDVLYIGKEHSFNHRYFNFKTPTSSATLNVEYYNGTTWTAVEKLVDKTFNLSENGHIYFELPGDWKESTVNSKELYWLKIYTSEEKAGLELYTIKNAYTTDDMIKDYFPELDRYQPSSKPDFMFLHELAKNEMINDMKAMRLIDYEDQVKGTSFIVMQQLASYKFLDLLLLPMIEYESIKNIHSTFRSSYNKRLGEIRLSIDTNKDEAISSAETDKISFTQIVRV